MRRSGFTLIELMLAGALSSLVIGSLYAIALTGFRTWCRTQDQIHVTRRMVQCLERMGGQMRNAVFIPEIPWETKPQRLTFVTVEEGTVPVQVSYERLSRGEFIETSKILPHGENRNHQWLTGVTSFHISYGFFSEDGKNVRWKPEWDDDKHLPCLVQVTLSVGSPSRTPLFLEKVVRISQGEIHAAG